MNRLSGSPCHVPPSTHHLIPQGLQQSGREGREWGGLGCPTGTAGSAGRCFLAEEASVGQVRPFWERLGLGTTGCRGGVVPFIWGPPWVSRLQVQNPLARKLLFLPLPPTRRPKVLFPSALLPSHCHPKLAAGVLSVLPSSFFWHLLQTPQTPDPPSAPTLGVLDTGATRRSFSVPQLCWA